VSGGLGVLVSWWAWVAARRTVEDLRQTGPVWATRNLSGRWTVAALLSVVVGAAMFSISEPVFAVFAWCTVFFSLVDLDTHAVPIAASRLASIASVPLWASASPSTGSSVVDICAGGIAALCLVSAVRLCSRGDLGGGDVAISPLVGMHAAWTGWSGAFVALAAGFVLAGAFVVAGIVTNRLTRRSHIPMVPFLFAGAWIWVLR